MRREHVEQLDLEGYSLISELGSGGFSTVYRAEHRRLHRHVAVKVLTVDLSEPAALRRFERECESVGRLSAHPCVVDVLDARVSPGGVPYIAMRLYEGSTLAHYVQMRGPLASAEALHVGIRMADALAAGHGMGIIHRDVKPENVLLDQAGESFLSDFGIAVLLDPDRSARTSAAFTRPHAAPEVVLDDDFGPLSDVYSLASTLHQSLSGRPPFVAETEGRLMVKLLRDPAPLVPRDDLQPGLQEAILRGLEKDPARRWPSMGAFSEALQRIARGAPGGPPPAAPPLSAEPSLAPSPSWSSDTHISPRPVPPPAAPVPAEPSTPAKPPRKPRSAAAVIIPLVIAAMVAGTVVVLNFLAGGSDPTASDASTPSPPPESSEPSPRLDDPEPEDPPAGAVPPSSGALDQHYRVGNCLNDAFGVVGCATPHVFQVTGFAHDERGCTIAGEDFVHRDSNYTTRVVHDHVGGSDVGPSLTGAMCVAALVDRDELQTFDFDLQDIVSNTLTAARLVGGCQAQNHEADLGDARDLGPCGVNRPWLSGHYWRKGPIPKDPPACRALSAAMDDRPYVAEPLGEPFDTADLWLTEVERGYELQADQEPSFFVPRLEVEVPNGDTQTFEAAVAQAMPIPRPEDHPIHWRMVCGIRAY